MKVVVTTVPSFIVRLNLVEPVEFPYGTFVVEGYDEFCSRQTERVVRFDRVHLSWSGTTGAGWDLVTIVMRGECTAAGCSHPVAAHFMGRGPVHGNDKKMPSWLTTLIEKVRPMSPSPIRHIKQEIQIAVPSDSKETTVSDWVEKKRDN